MTAADRETVILVEGVTDIDDLDAFLDRLDDVRADTGATVQVFDARYVVSADHLRRAADLADRAFQREENVARDRAVETLLYAAGRRQIDRALEMGVTEGENPVVALVDGHTSDDPIGAADAAAVALEELLEPADTLGEFDRELVMEFFDVSEVELAATDGGLANVVLERVALLDVEK